ncbi:MAG: hypothetical protein AAFY90_15105 [Pseudomonadota bacterium]
MDPGGVELLDSTLRIDLGRAEASAIASMSRLVGDDPVATGTCADPTQRFATWWDGSDEIIFVFSDNAFIGWDSGARGVTARRTCLIV